MKVPFFPGSHWLCISVSSSYILTDEQLGCRRCYVGIITDFNCLITSYKEKMIRTERDENSSNFTSGELKSSPGELGQKYEKAPAKFAVRRVKSEPLLLVQAVLP